MRLKHSSSPLSFIRRPMQERKHRPPMRLHGLGSGTLGEGACGLLLLVPWGISSGRSWRAAFPRTRRADERYLTIVKLSDSGCDRCPVALIAVMSSV